tara:strand:- start:38 stop:559 length:522 start_codon:yes stop_codon:yes gene_type:complete
MMRKLFIYPVIGLLAAGTILISAPTNGFANPDDSPSVEQSWKKMSPEARRQRMKEKYGFSEQQLDQFKTIKDASKTEAQGLKDQIKTKRQAMMDYMTSPDATESQALKYHQEMADLMNQMGVLRIKTTFKMKDLMTPEQFTAFSQDRQKRFKKFHERHGGKHGGGHSFGMGHH